MISRSFVLCFSLLPSWAHPMQPVYKTNSIIINQPGIFNAHICSPISRTQDLLSACPASLVLKAASGLLSGGKLVQTFCPQESSPICSFLTVVTSVFLHPVNRSVQFEMLRKIRIAKSNVVPPWKPMTTLQSFSRRCRLLVYPRTDRNLDKSQMIFLSNKIKQTQVQQRTTSMWFEQNYGGFSLWHLVWHLSCGQLWPGGLFLPVEEVLSFLSDMLKIWNGDHTKFIQVSGTARLHCCNTLSWGLTFKTFKSLKNIARQSALWTNHSTWAHYTWNAHTSHC